MSKLIRLLAVMTAIGLVAGGGVAFKRHRAN